MTKAPVALDDAIAAVKALPDTWRPIEEHPQKPMPVVFFEGNMRFYSWPEGRSIEEPDIREPDYGRAEACSLGYWDGKEWVYSCTNHPVFEFSGDEEDTGKPTLWKPLLMPLPIPPEANDGQ